MGSDEPAQDPPTPSPASPIRFGNYLLERRLGHGGMAEVWKGRAGGVKGFEKVVCVKRVLRHLLASDQHIAMFIEEAKLSARLSHPNIAQVFELGEVDGELYIAMEYVRGRDLQRVQNDCIEAKDPLPPPAAAYVAREMCHALAYAHEFVEDEGHPLPIIHRDVSPHNVMIGDDGRVKLVDFGVAKALMRGSEHSPSGLVKGKLAYLAPEQLHSLAVSPQTDIFAAGTVFWEMLANERLFIGDSDAITVHRLSTLQVQPPSAFNPRVPPVLDRIAMKALEREPADRYATAAQMALELERFCAENHFTATAMRQVLYASRMPGSSSTELRFSTGDQTRASSWFMASSGSISAAKVGAGRSSSAVTRARCSSIRPSTAGSTCRTSISPYRGRPSARSGFVIRASPAGPVETAVRAGGILRCPPWQNPGPGPSREALQERVVASFVDRYCRAPDGLRLHYLIDTHTHADHFSATQRLARELKVPVVMHRSSPAPYVDLRLGDGEMLLVGKLRLQVMHTPGHTRDSICIVAEDRVFTGDTLLIQATGRTDLPSGDPNALYDSLFAHVLKLDPAMKVHPAHDYKGRGHSTIGDELAKNPRLQKRDRNEFVEMMQQLNLTMPTHITEALRTNMSGGKTVAQMLDEAGATVPFMSLPELNRRIAAGDTQLTLLDVRERDAFQAAHLPGAMHLPRGQLELKVNEALPDPTRRIVVYCDFGRISTLAAATLRQMGFLGAVALDGGVKSWKEAGYPLEAGGGG